MEEQSSEHRTESQKQNRAHGTVTYGKRWPCGASGERKVFSVLGATAEPQGTPPVHPGKS